MNQPPNLAREIFPLKVVPPGAGTVAGRFVRPGTVRDVESDPKAAPAPAESQDATPKPKRTRAPRKKAAP